MQLKKKSMILRQAKREKSLQKLGLIAIYCALLLISREVLAQEEDEQTVWYDNMHTSISESVADSAQWFDNFFANENSQEDEKAMGEVRIRLGWEPRTRELNNFDAKVKLRVKLPNLKDKVDLILSDYDEQDDKVNAGRVEDINRQDRLTVALRFKPRPDSKISHRIGFGRRFQYFFKSSYEDVLTLSDDFYMRYGASVYYYNRDKLGTDFSATFDYDYSDQQLLRFSNRFYFRDRTNDWLWQHNWQSMFQVDDKTALICGYYIEGLSQPSYRLEEYLLSIKLRKNSVREWMYFDVEPFILWRRDEGFSASYGIALRVEGFFGET